MYLILPNILISSNGKHLQDRSVSYLFFRKVPKIWAQWFDSILIITSRFDSILLATLFPPIRNVKMASTQDAWYISLLGLAEHFRTSNPPDIKSCIQCLQAVFNFKPPQRVEARTHLQLGNILLTHTKNIDLARTHLEQSVSFFLLFVKFGVCIVVRNISRGYRCKYYNCLG